MSNDRQTKRRFRSGDNVYRNCFSLLFWVFFLGSSAKSEYLLFDSLFQYGCVGVYGFYVGQRKQISKRYRDAWNVAWKFIWNLTTLQHGHKGII